MHGEPGGVRVADERTGLAQRAGRGAGDHEVLVDAHGVGVLRDGGETVGRDEVRGVVVDELHQRDPQRRGTQLPQARGVERLDVNRRAGPVETGAAQRVDQQGFQWDTVVGEVSGFFVSG